VRLSEIEREYGERVDVRWRAFPLVPDSRPGRLSTEATRAGRERARAEEPRARFAPPPPGTPLPASSLPALTAAKAAARQGAVVFQAFHARVFEAHFGDNLDIGRPDVLWRVAEASGVDMARFQSDCAGGEPHRGVLEDYAEGAGWFGVSALPAVIFDEKVSLVGAVPVERYRLLVDWILAGEPGGLIPLDWSDRPADAAGQSAVGRPDAT
jgi:predicted DsbA family dithiol-disulfide isomerase